MAKITEKQYDVCGNYYRNEPSNPLSYNSESFKYETGIKGNTYNLGSDEDGYDANKIGKNETEIETLR